MAPVRMLLTGQPGVGKTTLCGKVHERLRELPGGGGAKLLGFLGRERREGGARVGFDMESLDGSQREPLATVGGPATGHKVSKYHVQLEAFERLTLPILDEVSARPSQGGVPRVLIFDEIGKMELFSDAFVQRVERILSSTDPDLHVLGTVALQGSGFIAKSKAMAEVLQVTFASRDADCDRVFERFAAALQTAGCEGGRPSESSGGAEGSAPPAKRPAPSGGAVQALPVRFDDPGKGSFSAVYLKNPDANFASVNAGDYLLYVGGAGINRAFEQSLRECGHEPKDKFVTLHEALLARAAAAPGSLCRLRRGDVFRRPETAETVKRMKCTYCKTLSDCWESELPSWRGMPHHEDCWSYYEDWLFKDIVSISGMLPEDADMRALQPVGFAAVAVFPEGRRPYGNDRSVAMVYAIGPNCGSVRKKGRREVDKMDKQKFLSVVEATGSCVSATVEAHNADAAEQELPTIEVLRMCLLSGAVYKHPDASKLEVAKSLIRGLARLEGGAPRLPCLVDFAFDEDVFKRAWIDLGLAAGE